MAGLLLLGAGSFLIQPWFLQLIARGHASQDDMSSLASVGLGSCARPAVQRWAFTHPTTKSSSEFRCASKGFVGWWETGDIGYYVQRNQARKKRGHLNLKWTGR
uniref:Secreted protein n=1 Tax=Bionectria ochroleuca TaxID=29856 RepID=A0A8H7K7P8_BIOOC